MGSHQVRAHGTSEPHPAGQGLQPGQPDPPGPSGPLLTPEIVTLAAVVVLGSIMTILDAAIGSAASAINIVQRLAAALGTALLAVTLQRAMTAALPGFHGSISRAGMLAAGRAGALAGLAHAFDVTFWVALALTAAALAPALLLPGGSRGPSRPAPRQAGPARS